MILTSTISD